MDTQQLIIALAEKLHRQDPTKTDEWNWLAAETIINNLSVEKQLILMNSNLTKLVAIGCHLRSHFVHGF